MTTEKIVSEFVKGATSGKASHLTIEGNKLYNYATVIAQREGNKILLNVTKYSTTTTKHQNRLRREIPSNMLVEVEADYRGVTDLTRI